MLPIYNLNPHSNMVATEKPDSTFDYMKQHLKLLQNLNKNFTHMGRVYALRETFKILNKMLISMSINPTQVINQQNLVDLHANLNNAANPCPPANVREDALSQLQAALAKVNAGGGPQQRQQADAALIVATAAKRNIDARYSEFVKGNEILKKARSLSISLTNLIKYHCDPYVKDTLAGLILPTGDVQNIIADVIDNPVANLAAAINLTNLGMVHTLPINEFTLFPVILKRISDKVGTLIETMS